jgi:cell wall-associated NlpC family hydrolase
MRSINLLFLIVFLPVFTIGCSAIHRPDRALAPVDTAGSSEANGAAPTPPPVLPRKPAAPPVATAPNHAADTARSHDALFVALAALGIDYQWGGRSPATGFDCSGLVAHIFRDAYGLNLPTHTTAQSRLGKPIALDQLETGDLVFYNTMGKPNTHVGIYIGDSRFIHAPRTGAAVRIERMSLSYWKTRYSGARRIVF